jgi:rod shape determining protein RodA
MTPLIRKLLGLNWVLVGAVIALSVFGVIAVYSASYFRTDEYWHKQTTWMCVGFGVFLITSLIPYKFAKWIALPMYLVATAAVILTYKIGVLIGGARCWIKVPGVGLFQPSQLAVIAGVLVVSLFLSQFRRLHPFLKLAFVGAIVVGPMLLILKQPDIGMVLVWITAIMSILLVSGIPKRYLITIVLIGLCLVPLAYNFGLKDYQRARITAFIDPEIDPKGSAWAINQSLIAIGSGGFSGKGFKAPNTQVEQGFLPGTTVHTDYIYSAIGEQWGFIGGVALIGTFSLLILSMLFTAYSAADEFGLLITAGITGQLFFHVYQNIGMTISLMPVTGIPLPLISYGGTFVVMVMFGLGLVNSVWVHRKEIA